MPIREPRKHPLRLELWIKSFIAVLVGNILYFALAPKLPPAARHRSFSPDLGTLVDLWFCLFFYGLIELILFLWRRRKA